MKLFYQWLMQRNGEAKAKIQSTKFNLQWAKKAKQSKQNARQGAKMELQINVENK